MNIKEIRDKATKTVELAKMMNQTFPESMDENIKLAIMAAIQDAYNAGLAADVKPNEK
jgi:hypothetical protein